MSYGGVKYYSKQPHRDDLKYGKRRFHRASSSFVSPGNSWAPQEEIQKVEATEWTWHGFSALKRTRPDTILTSYP